MTSYIFYLIGYAVPFALIGSLVVAFTARKINGKRWLIGTLLMIFALGILAGLNGSLSIVTPTIATLLAMLVIWLVYLIVARGRRV